MAENFPGPYELRIKYTTTPVAASAIQHTQRLNIELVEPAAQGQLFSAYTVITGTGGNIALNTLVDAWVALLRPTISSNAGNTIDFVELWKYTPLSYDADFWSVYSVNLAGTHASAATPAGQNILTFRTQEGGTMKLYIMESPISGSAIDPPPFQNAALDAIAAYVATTPRPFLGRDTSRPFTVNQHFPSQNEALFRKRYRNV